MKYTRLVEKYLDGDLQGEELSSFELEILRNPEVAEEVERIRNLEAFSRKAFSAMNSVSGLLKNTDDLPNPLDENPFKNDLESLEIHKIDDPDPDYQDFMKKVKTYSRKHSPKKISKHQILVPGYIIWVAAACFLLLLAFSIMTVLTPVKSKDLHDLYARFYNPYPADVSTRDKVNIPSDPYSMGINEYQKSNYETALSYFNNVDSVNILNNSIYLLKGICLMETRNFDVAARTFRNLSDDPVLKDFGQWYSGLCYLELQLPDKAKELFMDLSYREGYYKKISEKVLKNL